MAVNGITGANYLLTRLGNSYQQEDCIHAVVINLIRNCPGGDKSYRTAGCTELWNSINSSKKYRHCTKRMTLAEAKREGLMIGDLPVIYNSDTGICEHIAYYMGGIGGYECIHSSASKGCVCGTTLANGFTHVIRHRDIEGCIVESATDDEVYEDDEEVIQDTTDVLYSVIVNTVSGPLNLRSKASSSGTVLTQIPKSSMIGVIEETNSSWLKVEYAGIVGYVSRSLTKRIATESNTDSDYEATPDNTGGDWGVFVPCASKSDAQKFAALFNISVVCQRTLDD